MLGLFLATPGDLLLGQLVGAGFALAVIRHNNAQKLAFNLASFAFSTTVALVVFQVIGDPTHPLGPQDWLAGFLAALVADFMSSVTVQAVISVSTGQKPDWSGSVTGRGLRAGERVARPGGHAPADHAAGDQLAGRWC